MLQELPLFFTFFFAATTGVAFISGLTAGRYSTGGGTGLSTINLNCGSSRR